MKARNLFLTAVLVLGLLTILGGPVIAEEPTPPEKEIGAQAVVGTAFTYQGQLKQSGVPANGTCDFQFKLYNATSAGTQVGTTVTKGDVTVTNGLFTVELDFGAGIFTGEARYLEIGVRPGASTGTYTTLSPRQALTPAPYALALPGLWTQQNATSPNLIGGYSGNSVSSGLYGATIGGGGSSGYSNTVTANYGTVAGGRGNTSSGPDATVGGGYRNTASGVVATVGGGYYNTASGNFSFAAGRWAQANHQGAFVWGDSTAANVASTGDNQFIVRASGGIWLGTTSSLSIPSGRFINTSTGGYLSTGGVWTNASSRAYKEDIAPLTTGQALEALAGLEPVTFRYKTEGEEMYVGFIAEDVPELVATADRKGLSAMDIVAVLTRVVQEQQKDLAGQSAQIAALEARLAALEALVARLAQER